jgi:hypothetical protein
LIRFVAGNRGEQSGRRINWTPPMRPERACRTDLAKRIIHAFFVRASVDFLEHRDASDAFPADNVNPGVLQFDIVTKIRIGRLSKPFVKLSFGVFRRNDAKDSL